MREIKFRAWDTKEHKMIEHNSQQLVFIPCIDSLGADRHYHRDGDHNIGLFDWASADLISRRYELMQYTGLKDKNGKEIYHRDIVKHNGQNYQIDSYHGAWVLSKTVFGKYQPCFFCHDIYGKDNTLHCEVIGNEIENPELRNGKA